MALKPRIYTNDTTWAVALWIDKSLAHYLTVRAQNKVTPAWLKGFYKKQAGEKTPNCMSLAAVDWRQLAGTFSKSPQPKPRQTAVAPHSPGLLMPSRHSSSQSLPIH